MKLGFAEIIIVLLVAMVVIGPDKLPYYARNAGKMLQSFRKALNETTEEVRETLDETMGDVLDPIKDLKKEADELQSEMKGTVKEVFDPFKDVQEDVESVTKEAKDLTDSAETTI